MGHDASDCNCIMPVLQLDGERTIEMKALVIQVGRNIN